MKMKCVPFFYEPVLKLPLKGGDKYYYVRHRGLEPQSRQQKNPDHLLYFYRTVVGFSDRDSNFLFLFHLFKVLKSLISKINYFEPLSWKNCNEQTKFCFCLQLNDPTAVA